MLPFVSMTIEDKYVTFNVQKEGWYFERDSEDMTMNGFGWTPWFKLSPSTLNMCIIRSLYGSVYDTNCLSLPDGQRINVCKVMHTPIHPLSNRAVK